MFREADWFLRYTRVSNDDVMFRAWKEFPPHLPSKWSETAPMLMISLNALAQCSRAHLVGLHGYGNISLAVSI